MIDRERLLEDLKRLTASLVDDLRARSDEVPEVREHVRDLYQGARHAGRTDRTLEEWREDLLAQIAVAWVLATVFVRFCEDTRLYATPLLSGPGDRRQLAGDHRADWLAAHPEAGDREWLEEVFRRYRTLPALEELFGDHNALWQFGPSADGAKSILQQWQAVVPETGVLVHDFTDPELDTRFLGDLYQDLSDHTKKTYALLQTPEFVEEFILDRTLDPAIETFGLDRVRMIDPTCGSGHFLLGAFDRLLERWRDREPGTPIRELVQRSLDAVNGVDLNPFAAAIAKFRLLVSALRASKITELADAPRFKIHVAVGDSLLHGRRQEQLFSGLEGMSPLMRHRYPTEDEELANELLEGGRYHAVVGNPPYINVKDPALSDAYRALYSCCHRQYSLGVPFTERFFDLATTASESGDAGYVGMITTNTFMKREFGKKLVEDYLPTIDLTHIIDTSGAYIPGHGTPTVILFGRHQSPVSDSVRTVLGIRGEPGRPRDAATGEVWTSICTLVDRPGTENEFVSVEDAPRSRFKEHPWSLQGGYAPVVKRAIEGPGVVDLGTTSRLVGYTGQTNADTVFLAARGAHQRNGVEPELVRFLIRGEMIRDWILQPEEQTLFPYSIELAALIHLRDAPGLFRRIWPYKATLGSRRTFNKKSYAEEGRPWWEWHQVALDRVPGPCITFAFVATHNHFVLDRGGKVFKQSAPVIKLPESATEDDHLNLLGLLNSSTACFWMKQVFHGKGQGGVGQESRAEWEEFLEFDGTKLKQFPIPNGSTLGRARALDSLAIELASVLPAAILSDAESSRAVLAEARKRAEALRAKMVAEQEELDWQCYALYGLTDEELTVPHQSVPPLGKGQRAFEIVLARRVAAGETASTWFERHGSEPITIIPPEWPEEYRRLLERRIGLIESTRSIGLLERPEYKRRWNWDDWEDLEKKALRSWLLDRLEQESFWSEPKLTTTGRLTDLIRADQGFGEAARLLTGRVDTDLTSLVTDLVLDEVVPYVAGHRYRASGLRKRKAWESVWDQQRAEDAIDARAQLPEDHPDHLSQAAAKRLKTEQGLDRIPVPPKYGTRDFANGTFWRLRGKLDVPKERFILYAGTRMGSDSTPVVGWAGWSHLERARALASHYQARRDEGAEAPELIALLAGLQELVPWLLQWHNELDTQYGERMGDFFRSFVGTEARGVGATVEDLMTWTPE